jgi:hypothetical protein
MGCFKFFDGPRTRDVFTAVKHQKANRDFGRIVNFLKREIPMFYRNAIRLGLVFCLLWAAEATGATYNEAISGDLSSNQATPTAFRLFGGSNSIMGTVGGAETQDFVTVIIPSNFKLDSYVHVAYSGSDLQGFTGFRVGDGFPGSPFDPGSYAGYAHFGTGATNPGVNGGSPTSTVGVNLLPVPYMADNGPGGTAAGATGFAPPLPGQSYTFLIQQLGGNISYQFDFSISLKGHPGDFDLDGDVDGADFVAWQTSFPTVTLPDYGADGDGDWDIDGADFVIWQTNFPYTPGPGTAPVPEPTAAILGLAGLIGIALRCRFSH